MREREETASSATPGTPDAVLSERRLLACLALGTTYCAIVVALVSSRFEVDRFGLRIPPFALPAWQWAWWMHVAGVAAGGVLLFVTRLVHIRRPFASQLALAALPLLLLASIDQLLTITVKPLRADEGLYRVHPRRDWALRPGWRGPPAADFVRVNSLGFRGPELSAVKAANERRILLLGDSVAFGLYVSEEDRVGALLQERLKGRNVDGRTIVINAAVPGYSPWQELDMLTHEGLESQPDFVVLVFCLNDVLEKYRLARFGGSTRGLEPPTPSALEWSGLFRAARAWRGESRRPTTEEFQRDRVALRFSRLFDDPDAGEVKQAWIVTLENVARIVEAARVASLPIAIVCAPVSEQFGPPPQRGPQDILEAFAKKQGVPFLDLLPDFARYADDHNVDVATLFVDPLHFSPTGHQIAAELIDAMLVRLGWVE